MHWTAGMPRRTALGLPVVPDVKILRSTTQMGVSHEGTQAKSVKHVTMSYGVPIVPALLHCLVKSNRTRNKLTGRFQNVRRNSLLTLADCERFTKLVGFNDAASVFIFSVWWNICWGPASTFDPFCLPKKHFQQNKLNKPEQIMNYVNIRWSSGALSVGRVMKESILSITPGDKFPKRCGWAAGGSGMEVALCLEFQWHKVQDKLHNATQISPSDPQV